MTSEFSTKRRAFLQAVGTLGFLGGMAGNATAADRTQSEKRDELLVGVAPSAAGVRRTAERALPAEARIVHENARLGYVTVELPARASATAKSAVADAIENQRGIEYVEPNTVHKALYIPNDSRFDEQYVPQMVNAPEAWDATLGERAVTIAIVDTGVEYNHPDLQGNVGDDAGYDFVDGDDDPAPDVPSEEYHGTHVAGIAAGKIDNGEGITGIANATLLGVRTLNEEGWGYTSDISDGIQWATDKGVDIINLSLGGGGYTETMQKAVSYAYGKGMVLVAAAGNDYGGPVSYPAAYDECIAVSALDQNGTLASYSNVGPEVELCAPGTSVLSTTTEARGSYERLSGTSMATPVVSGVAALVLSRQNLTNTELRTQLKNTAVGMGLSPEKQGSGQVDAAAAVGNQLSRMLTIDGDGSRTDYRFSVSESVEPIQVNNHDTVRSDGATGYVGDGSDKYAFSGEITEFVIDGDAVVFLDGERIDPAQLLPHTLTIDGDGSHTDYRFVVSGSVEPVQVNNHDTVRASSAEGYVGGGSDTYAFSGEITDFAIDGDAAVFVDGERIDPSEFLDRRLTFDGSGSITDYRFAVSGSIEPLQVNNHETVRASSAEGYVGSGTDRYAFSDAIESLVLDGDARVELDRSTRVISIIGTGGRADYRFAVSGSIDPIQVNNHDSVNESSAEGYVGGGSDHYAYSGDLRSLSLDGMTVSVDDTTPNTDESPLLGVYSGLSDADFDTIDRMEEWQDMPYAVQNLFVPWNPDEGHMNWLFDRVLPKIWANDRVPLITWEPFTPGVGTASVNTQSLVESGEYTAYLQSLDDTTPDDIEVRIGNGEYDDYIDTWTSRLKAWLAGPDGVLGTADDRQAYIRLAHEMNGDWYPWSPTVGNSSPESYVEMWHHVHSHFEEMGIGATTLQWMWCVNADDVGEYSAEQLYPGDAYVDWLSIDGYQWGHSQEWSHWESPESIFSNMLGRVRSLADKPLCIGETASTSMTSSGHNPEQKDEWIRDAFEYFENEGIEMWCWFNEDKETDWAMFDGVRGTETVTFDGELINAYAAYRKAVDMYSATANTMESEPMITGDSGYL